MSSLSVILITHNEENNIARCLKSVHFANEIIVIDSCSTDRTVEIAKQFTSNLIQHEFDGDLPQRERGFQIAKSEWLFYIDADEEVSDELSAAIKNVVAGHGDEEGFYVNRKVFVLGKWIKHGGWYPDYTFRLFRKSKYIIEHAEVHGGITVRGLKGNLDGHLFHYTYPRLEDYLNKMNDYTSLHVSNKLRDHAESSVGIHKIVLSPFSHFVRKYFSQYGFRDGMIGFILAVCGALYTLALYAKLWEYQFQKLRNGTLPPITNIEVQKAKRKYG